MNTEVSLPESPDTDQPQKLNLSIAIDKVSACERHITVTIPREDIDVYYERQYDELLPQAEIPGFRPGKAPKKLIQKMFRKQVDQQVKSGLIIDSLAQVQDQSDFSPISEPDLEFEAVVLPPEGDLVYEFNIEVRPEFDMPNWKGLQFSRPEHEFTDEEIDLQVHQFASRFADLVPVEEPVQKGDYVICRIETRKDGKVLAQVEEETIQVRKTLDFADASIESFEELVIGKSAGETISTTIKISEFSPRENLRGETVEVDLEILDVKRIDEQELESVSEKMGFGTVDELRTLVRNSLFQNLQYEQRRGIRQQITDLLTAQADWDLPPDLLRRQSSRELERAAMEMRSSGFSDQEVISRVNKMRSNILEDTAKLLKEHFILERIAEVEEVTDEPADYEAEINRLAQQQGDSPRRVRARLERDGQLDSLRNMVIENKVIDLITESGTFKPVPFRNAAVSESFALDFFVGGRATNIPDAKHEGGDLPPIPGVKDSKKTE